jgi:predicted nuclease with RNAse H fold
MLAVGLDLAGVEIRPTGFCFLKSMKAETCQVYTDKEVLMKTQEASPQVIAIDAPLSLPPGRQSIEQKTDMHLRECDRELLRDSAGTYIPTACSYPGRSRTSEPKRQ